MCSLSHCQVRMSVYESVCVCACASCKNGCYMGHGQKVCDHTERSSGGADTSLVYGLFEEGASFSPAVGFTLYFSARGTSTNIRSAGTAAAQ